jgi:NAD(P)-dependent dehydrogenase (short-subunit alcohol dehydrogenase family)
MRNVKTRNAAAVRELEELAKRESLELQVLDLDVTEEPSAEQAVANVLAKAGRIDVLINNAATASWTCPKP